MGKASRAKRDRSEPTGDIHQQIADEAERARSMPTGVASDGYPALTELMRAARDQVLQSAPTAIEFHGRTYWCRVSHGMSLIELFDSPAKGTPLARTICGSTDKHGHRPAH
jgi:hypothetical protein